jgi:transcriptional regulator with AAA-type ATPase domain
VHDAMRAQLTPDMLRHLKSRGQKANVGALKSAVKRLCLAATQPDAGQRPNTTPETRVIWESPEIDMLQFIILCEAVALVLSGKLDEMENENDL